jgi:7-cyano-7-deazaguanine synthase in queuosine biosynthesis
MAKRAHHLLCNGAKFEVPRTAKRLRLDYRADRQPNVRIELPSFVEQLLHIPPRLLDLLEIAAYIYCADRWSHRGGKSAVEYHAWSRDFFFHVKVRDFNFWSQPDIGEKLNAALSFLSGDRQFEFEFQPDHETPPTSLFDLQQVSVTDLSKSRIALFSGGLDSLAGVYDILSRTGDRVCLVSHRSSQPQVGRTQDQLVYSLQSRFPGRVQHYKFHCNLTGQRAAEETQRTRMFLYSAIATAIAATVGVKEVTIFENGITSLNFPRRQDLINARATRTTHPKTISLLQDLFGAIAATEFHIATPFIWKTKADVVDALANATGSALASSAVSCSRTFLSIGSASHCGECSQCIDRRFASYAARIDELDDSVPYAVDFINSPISNDEARTTLVDYMRQAHEFATWNVDHFGTQLFSSISEMVDYVGAANEEEAYNRIAELCRRHGKQVMNAIAKMRDKHDRLEEKVAKGSLLSLIGEREYLKPPVLRLVKSVCDRLSIAIPLAFQSNPPKDEPDLNDKISAILNTDRDNFSREHPAVRFGLATAIPDHSTVEDDLVIETKYLRGSTTPSKASDAMAADLTKYPPTAHILFAVYDPERAISDDQTFRSAFEDKGRCTVHIIR